MKFILASQSPRRIELMNYLTNDFEVRTASIDEEKISNQILTNVTFPYTKKIADQIVVALAKEKATAIQSNDKVIIGSDTLVFSPTQGILGKPKSPIEAENMLIGLSKERTHTVHTGVCIGYQDIYSTFVTQATVTFHSYDVCQHELILDYIHSGSPFDKAGAYSIGDQGSLFIQSIQGDYYTILGFPVSEIYRRLKERDLL